MFIIFLKSVQAFSNKSHNGLLGLLLRLLRFVSITMECSIILIRNSITFEKKFNIMRSMSAMPTTNLNNLFEQKTFQLRV